MDTAGLTSEEAVRRLRTAAPQVGHRRNSGPSLMVRQFRSPIIWLLLAAAVLSFGFDEQADSAIIILIVLVSALLGFMQERGAVRRVDALMASVAAQATVVRDGTERRVPVSGVVPGDLVVLRTGDVVPGDCRVVDANGLLVNEAALTGENYPRRKSVTTGVRDDGQRTGTVFLGTHVASGEARVVVERTGTDTEFGAITEHVSRQHLPTAFERGTTQFGYLLMRWTGVLVIMVLTLNLVTGRPFVESVLFSLSLTVGLTPQMLPAIVTLSLSRGTALMARRKVIVKRLDAIEDVGGMDLLCTDKTGTLTTGTVTLVAAVGPDGMPSAEVRRLAAWNARFQTGYPNPMDDAILAAAGPSPDGGTCTGEIPFDFMRRRLSVRVARPDGSLLVTKGALEPLLGLCTHARGPDGTAQPIAALLDDVTGRYGTLSEAGSRVIGVATRRCGDTGDLTVHDESGMTFEGFLCFDDPPKDGVAGGIERLAALGVGVCVVSGDNRLAVAHTAAAVGIPPGPVLTGEDIRNLDDGTLADAIRGVTLFAEIDPLLKERIVRTHSRDGRTVGFLGDGINDTPALHAADVGISVENAVDVARQTADLVLLEKDLSVLADGIEQGRAVFANTLKYVNVTTSANFGNMLSFAVATAFLPFLPLLPSQILLLNFLSDIPGMTIATDRVDPEQELRHHRWDMRSVRRFMLAFGLTSTLFDMAAFVLLRWVLSDSAVELRSGWFVLSTLTELAAMLVLRTQRRFWRSMPSPALLWSSLTVAAGTFVLPYSPLGPELRLIGPPVAVVACLVALVVLYVAVNEAVKKRIPVFGT